MLIDGEPDCLAVLALPCDDVVAGSGSADVTESGSTGTGGLSTHRRGLRGTGGVARRVCEGRSRIRWHGRHGGRTFKPEEGADLGLRCARLAAHVRIVQTRTGMRRKRNSWEVEQLYQRGEREEPTIEEESVDTNEDGKGRGRLIVRRKCHMDVCVWSCCNVLIAGGTCLGNDDSGDEKVRGWEE